jgi:hypothetical protein
MSRQENVGGTAFIYCRAALLLALSQFCGTFHVEKTSESDGLLSEKLRRQEDRQRDKFRSETCRS